MAYNVIKSAGGPLVINNLGLSEVSVEAATASSIPLTIKSAASQSASLTEWQDSNENVVLKIGPRIAQNNATVFELNPSKQLNQGSIFKIWGYESSNVDVQQSHDALIDSSLSSPNIRWIGSLNISGTIYNPDGRITFTPTYDNGGYLKLGILDSEGLRIWRHENRTPIVGINSALTTAQLNVEPNWSGKVGVLVRGVASQSANLTEWQDSTGVAKARITASGEFSCPGGTNSQTFGPGATAAGGSSVAIGQSSTASSSSSVAVGTSSTVAATGIAIGAVSNGGLSDAVAVGYSATANAGGGSTRNVAVGSSASAWNRSVAIGWTASTTGAGGIAIGAGAVAGEAEFVATSTSNPITNVYFGDGKSHVTPATYTIHGTSGAGTNIVGGNLILAPGKSTGNATPASVVIQNTVATTSGSTAQTLSDVLVVQNGVVSIERGYLGDVSGTWLSLKHDNAAPALTLDAVMPGVNHYYNKISSTAGSNTTTTGRSRSLLLDCNSRTDSSSNPELNSICMVNAHNESAAITAATLFGVFNNGARRFQITANGSTYIGTGSGVPSGQLHVVANSSSTIGTVVQGAASQSVNLQEWQDSSGAVLAEIESGGKFKVRMAGGSSLLSSYEAARIYTSNSSYHIVANAGGTIHVKKWNASTSTYNAGVISDHPYVSFNTGTHFSILAGGDNGFGSGTSIAQFDEDATAGNTRFILYDVDSGQPQRVKVGANGTGPGGTGRALYIDDTV